MFKETNRNFKKQITMETIFETLYCIIAILLTAVISAGLIISLILLIKETFKNK